jgi:UDP-N-acetylmuramate dehydrogenase
MLLQENIPLAPLTTLNVGGPARYFCEAATEDDIRDAVSFAREYDLPIFILGGGSNVVVSDCGFRGLVLKIALRGIEQHSEDKNRVLFEVAAGEDWDAFVAQTIDANCAGIECLSGIPGTVGGTPVQNVGAYRQEVSQTITEVRALDLESLEPVTLSNAECAFGYRTSRFNTIDRGHYVITRVSFVLAANGRPCLCYADVQNYFANRVDEPTLKDVRDAVREIRRSKAMLIVPGEEDSRSAGSFFKNPVVTEEQYLDLWSRVGARRLQLPSYPAGAGFRKIPAAWLVEHAGFSKGYTKGEAGISSRHALAIVNRGLALSAEIVALKDEIQERVRAEFGIELQPEPVLVGF